MRHRRGETNRATAAGTTSRWAGSRRRLTSVARMGAGGAPNAAMSADQEVDDEHTAPRPVDQHAAATSPDETCRPSAALRSPIPHVAAFRASPAPKGAEECP